MLAVSMKSNVVDHRCAIGEVMRLEQQAGVTLSSLYVQLVLNRQLGVPDIFQQEGEKRRFKKKNNCGSIVEGEQKQGESKGQMPHGTAE